MNFTSPAELTWKEIQDHYSTVKPATTTSQLQEFRQKNEDFKQKQVDNYNKRHRVQDSLCLLIMDYNRKSL